jgi:hypothetical protein
MTQWECLFAGPADETGEWDIAPQMYAFLQELFEANPNIRNNDFHVFGESYAGIIVMWGAIAVVLFFPYVCVGKRFSVMGIDPFGTRARFWLCPSFGIWSAWKLLFSL